MESFLGIHCHMHENIGAQMAKLANFYKEMYARGQDMACLLAYFSL